jgi:hypothetical protein
MLSSVWPVLHCTIGRPAPRRTGVHDGHPAERGAVPPRGGDQSSFVITSRNLPGLTGPRCV